MKIKFNNNVDKLINLLHQLTKQKLGNLFIVDANTCWSPQNFIDFEAKINKIESLKNSIAFIEQPFDIGLSKYEEWSSIKNASSLKILAD